MDTARRNARPLTRWLGSALLAVIVLGGAPAHANVTTTIATGIVVHDADPDELDLVRWAVGRYAAAGLSLPSMAIYFHDKAIECGSETRLGFYRDGRLDICMGTLVNAMTRHLVLHEMAHAFTESYETPVIIAAFLRARDLETWDSWDRPWVERGWEQATDIVAWGVGERIITPQAPGATADQLGRLYRLLTGTALPA